MEESAEGGRRGIGYTCDHRLFQKDAESKDHHGLIYKVLRSGPKAKGESKRKHTNQSFETSWGRPSSVVFTNIRRARLTVGPPHRDRACTRNIQEKKVSQKCRYRRSLQPVVGSIAAEKLIAEITHCALSYCEGGGKPRL